jgi:hypothetical protein
VGEEEWVKNRDAALLCLAIANLDQMIQHAREKKAIGLLARLIEERVRVTREWRKVEGRK